MSDDASNYFSIRATNARQNGRGPAPPTCPVCCGLGWVRADANPGEPEFGRMSRCPVCGQDGLRAWLRQNCGLVGSALEVRLERDWSCGEWPDVDGDERGRRISQRQAAYQAMSRAVESRAGLLTLWGDFGSGKSHGLALVCNELRERLLETYYAPLATVLDHLRSLYGQKRDTSEFWRRLLDVPALALDEVTRFNATDWACEKLFVLVDTRYRLRDSHLTLFATNDDPRRSLPAGDELGYLFSRFREGTLAELRGDMRGAGNEFTKERRGRDD
jgi:DNA replication protein DnaC